MQRRRLTARPQEAHFRVVRRADGRLNSALPSVRHSVFSFATLLRQRSGRKISASERDRRHVSPAVQPLRRPCGIHHLYRSASRSLADAKLAECHHRRHQSAHVAHAQPLFGLPGTGAPVVPILEDAATAIPDGAGNGPDESLVQRLLAEVQALLAAPEPGATARVELADENVHTSLGRLVSEIEGRCGLLQFAPTLLLLNPYPVPPPHSHRLYGSSWRFGWSLPRTVLALSALTLCVPHRLEAHEQHDRVQQVLDALQQAAHRMAHHQADTSVAAAQHGAAAVALGAAGTVGEHAQPGMLPAGVADDAGADSISAALRELWAAADVAPGTWLGPHTSAAGAGPPISPVVAAATDSVAALDPSEQIAAPLAAAWSSGYGAVVDFLRVAHDAIAMDSGLRGYVLDVKRMGDAIAEDMEGRWVATPPLGRLVAYVLASAAVVVLMRRRVPWHTLRRPYADTSPGHWLEVLSASLV
jgi:hypothetical protein